MSRRRPARAPHKHLELTAEVAEQVAAAAAERASVGPCPGPCNRVYRRRAEQYTDALLVHLGRETRRARAATALDLDAVHARAHHYAAEEVTVPTPRPGRPVWCHRCAADIVDAMHNLPRLVAWVIDLGSRVEPTRAAMVGEAHVTEPVSTPVRVVEVRPFAVGMAVEVLDCGHRHTRTMGPAPQHRVCLTCVAGSIEPEPGRLAPAQQLAQGGSSAGRAPVSPAGSPAWVEADAAIEWVCYAAEDAAHVLGHEDRTPALSGTSSAFRYRELVRASRYLEQWSTRILESRTAVPFGREALAIAHRLRRVAGMDHLVHRLDAECPVCDRRALERPDGGDRIRCRHCSNTWDEHHYQLLVRTQAHEATTVQPDEEPALP